MDYKSVHNRIIEKARSQNRIKSSTSYYEAHHIIPKCLGGTGSCLDWSWHKNIVLLTAKEHYIIHKLLTRIHPDNKKIRQAYAIMTWRRGKDNKTFRPGSRSYQEAKEGIKGLRFQEPGTIKQALHSTNQTEVNWNRIYKVFGMPLTETPKISTLEPQSLKAALRLAGIEKIDWKTVGLLPGVVERFKER